MVIADVTKPGQVRQLVTQADQRAPLWACVNSVGAPLTRPMFDDEVFTADVERRIPRGRLGTLDEMAAAVGFLASPCASLVNWNILLVEGGRVAW
jgi:Enoyl-(Acyl carrier protein) reductase